jgi:hypothetical protein
VKSDRFTLTALTFSGASPFYYGPNRANQTTTSRTQVYFAYRDALNRELRQLKSPLSISFPFDFSPFVFLPQVSECMHISSGDELWSGEGCETTYRRAQGVIECRCSHMSVFAVVDSSLETPREIGIIQLVFKNGSAFFTILYVFLVFVIGCIYTYGLDLQDFRYLHEQEELQGNEM